MKTTFNDFLGETADATSATSEEIIEMIKRDCKPFLEQSGGYFMRRGVSGLYRLGATKSENMSIYMKEVRKDRKPLSSDIDVHNLVDDWFKHRFGEKFRSKSMFVFGRAAPLTTLAEYGTPCYVFPIGEFKYIWSPHVRDMYISMTLPSEAHDDMASLQKAVDTWMDEHGYRTDDLIKALKDNKEIMVICDKYYALPMGYQSNKEELEKAFS